MNIYERVTIYTAKDYSDNATLTDIDRKSNAHYDQICDIMRNMGKDENGATYQVAWTSEEISPGELQSALNEKGDEYNFTDTLTDPYEKNNYLEEITIITKKEIDDNLSKEEQQAEEEKYSNQLIKDIKQLDEVKDFIYSWDSEFIDVQEIYQNYEWAFKEIFTKEEENTILNNFINEEITNNEFEIAYTTYSYGQDDEKSDIDFMKKVINIHGTDTKSIQSAIYAITISKGETIDFTNKLLQDTLKTDEYQQTFEREQSQTTEKSR